MVDIYLIILIKSISTLFYSKFNIDSTIFHNIDSMLTKNVDVNFHFSTFSQPLFNCYQKCWINVISTNCARWVIINIFYMTSCTCHPNNKARYLILTHGTAVSEYTACLIPPTRWYCYISMVPRTSTLALLLCIYKLIYLALHFVQVKVPRRSVDIYIVSRNKIFTDDVLAHPRKQPTNTQAKCCLFIPNSSVCKE